jgi:transcriptional regulator
MINADRIMDLTRIQRDILTALVNIYRKENRPVRSEEIAELIDRNTGTVRNQMQSLAALNLVKGVPGPKGGYKANASAYDALNLDGTEDTVAVPILKNGVVIDGASASEIVFTKVMNPHECNGMIRIIGNVKDFNEGDEILIGPTPVNKLYLRGDIVGRDDTMSQLFFHVKEISSVPRIPIRDVAKRAVHISPDAALQEAAKILILNGVREALVDESSPGLISMVDITRAMADGRTEIKVSEISNHDFLTIDSGEILFEAVKNLGRKGSNQLVVSDSGMLWGIITPFDLIKALTPT